MSSLTTGGPSRRLELLPGGLELPPTSTPFNSTRHSNRSMLELILALEKKEGFSNN